MIARAFIALALALCSCRASAQFSLPERMPRLEEGEAICNTTYTHCVVNFADWMKDKIAVPLADHLLRTQESRTEDLQDELEIERASKTVRCAAVTEPLKKTSGLAR